MKYLIFLFYIISGILSEESLETVDLIIQGSANSTYKSACEGITPSSARDCVVGTVEWDYRCCYVYYKKNKNKVDEKCRYLEDKASSIKKYAKNLKNIYNENYKIDCKGNFINFKIHSLFVILFLL